MRVLWISCLLLGIVTTLPTRSRRGTVTPRTSDPNLKYHERGFIFNRKPFGIDPAATGAATPPVPAPGYAGYPMGHAAGYEGAPPAPASRVPYTGLVDANPGYNPWGTPLPGYEGALPMPAPGLSYAGYAMEPGAGYEGAPPVAQYEGHPVPSDYSDGPAAAFPAYNPWAAAPPPHVPEMGAPYPDSPYPVVRYYEAPVATTQPDGQEAPPVAPDYYGHHWGSVGVDANEPVFSDVSDLAPVSSSNSRSRYMRGSTVFYEATYVPEEGPAVPAETISAPEEALGAGPATRLTPWMGYLQKRPAETSYAPEEALGPATRPTPWMGYSTGPLLQKRPAETSYAPEDGMGWDRIGGFERPFTHSDLYPSP